MAILRPDLNRPEPDQYESWQEWANSYMAYEKLKDTQIKFNLDEGDVIDESIGPEWLQRNILAGNTGIATGITVANSGSFQPALILSAMPVEVNDTVFMMFRVFLNANVTNIRIRYSINSDNVIYYTNIESFAVTGFGNFFCPIALRTMDYTGTLITTLEISGTVANVTLSNGRGIQLRYKV